MKSFAILASTALALVAASPAQAADLSLRYIGQQTFPVAPTFQSTTIGGLSGIDYIGGGNYIAISDDRSQFGQARYYSLDLDLTAAGFSGVNFTGVTSLKDTNGSPYATFASDTESVRQLANGNILYTSEGDKSRNINAFVREAQADGTVVRDLALPAGFQQTGPSGTTGIRNNLAFESLTLSSDGGTAFIATESALLQDGPIATGIAGTVSRIAAIDLATGLPGPQFVYPISAIAGAPGPGVSADNGLVELIALGNGQFLALERTFVSGVGNNIRIFEVDSTGATDVSGFGSLLGGGYTAASKQLLLDLGTLGITLDNVEGFTFGELLDNGSRSLILVSDNNFSASQFTQFLAFEVGSPVPEPASWAMMISGFGLIGGAMRRRNMAAATA